MNFYKSIKKNNNLKVQKMVDKKLTLNQKEYLNDKKIFKVMIFALRKCKLKSQ